MTLMLAIGYIYVYLTIVVKIDLWRERIFSFLVPNDNRKQTLANNCLNQSNKSSLKTE